MTDYVLARRVMVDNQIRPSSVTDRRILAAMGEIPRELFVPESRRPLAYVDVAHPLPGPEGRSLGAPAPFAKLAQLADIEPTHTVLDVGAGTGYASAVLSRLAGRVVALESDAALLEAARGAITKLGLANVEFVQAALDAGAPKSGPYDVILLGGLVTVVPPKLLEQLKEGGRLVALVRRGEAAVAHVYVRSGGEFAASTAFNATLPPLQRERPAEAFVF